MKDTYNLKRLIMALGLTFAAFGCDDGDCLLSSDCEDGYVCQRGECLRTCSEENTCPDGHICSDGFCQVAEEDIGGMSAAGGALGGMEITTDVGGANAMVAPADTMQTTMDQPPATETNVGGMAMSPDAVSMEMQSNPALNAGGSPASISRPSEGGALVEEPAFANEEDDGEEEGSSLFDLSGTYTVISRVITATGGPLEEDEEEQVLIRLTKLDGFRYRLEEYDLATIERTNVASSVSFAAPEGPGHYQFEYSILEAASGEGSQRSCSELETRFQRGSVRPSRGSRFELTGSETRTVSYEGEMCSAAGWETFLSSQWLPVPD